MEEVYDIRQGDCREVMREMPEKSVDAIVTDPPYGLSFMGKEWDHGVPGVQFWTEAIRVAKPGAHMLAFGGTRTFHRLTCAIEDAGWEIRDCVMWVYGSGFPKSHNLQGQWAGWGTALKPAWEPIIIARKPLIGTVAENVLKHGTGGINVDGCRVEGGGPSGLKPYTRNTTPEVYALGMAKVTYTDHPLGRWPANVIHDGSDEVVGLFPVQVKDGKDASTARFFYCPKVSKADRDACLNERPDVARRMFVSGGRTMKDGKWVETNSEPQARKNSHPTVKPTALMRYLCCLVTPPGGVVLDPFMGSGSTGKAAILEGFRFIGIDLNPEYIEIARGRIAQAAQESTTLF